MRLKSNCLFDPHYVAAISNINPAKVNGILISEDFQYISEWLTSIPFTTADDLATNPYSFLAVGQNEIEGIVSVPTSGTSGAVKRIFSTAEDIEETISFFEYGMRILVAPDSDRVALLMSQARPGNVGDLLGQSLSRWNIPFIAHGFTPKNDEVDIWIEKLTQWQPTCVVGVPTQILALARHPKAALLKKNLKTILLSGDVAEGRLVSELERTFSNCMVFRHYGLTECGLGGAVECGERNLAAPARRPLG